LSGHCESLVGPPATVGGSGTDGTRCAARRRSQTITSMTAALARPPWTPDQGPALLYRFFAATTTVSTPRRGRDQTRGITPGQPARPSRPSSAKFQPGIIFPASRGRSNRFRRRREWRTGRCARSKPIPRFGQRRGPRGPYGDSSSSARISPAVHELGGRAYPGPAPPRSAVFGPVRPGLSAGSPAGDVRLHLDQVPGTPTEVPPSMHGERHSIPPPGTWLDREPRPRRPPRQGTTSDPILVRTGLGVSWASHCAASLPQPAALSPARPRPNGCPKPRSPTAVFTSPRQRTSPVGPRRCRSFTVATAQLTVPRDPEPPALLDSRPPPFVRFLAKHVSFRRHHLEPPIRHSTMARRGNRAVHRICDCGYNQGVKIQL